MSDMDESDASSISYSDNDQEFDNQNPLQTHPAPTLEFNTYSTTDITQSQQTEQEHVAGILGCNKEHAATLLRHYHWNKETLIEKYMDHPEKTLDDAGVIIDTNKRPKLINLPGFACDICCNDDPNLQSLALSCHHRFCVDCYKSYLDMKIIQNGESRRIQCPMSNCNLIVDEETVKMIVDPSTLERYSRLLIRTYVDDRLSFKWCPSPNCEYALECQVNNTQLHEIVPTLTCACGHEFCFGCTLPDHKPAICELVKLWLKKCQDDSETANWMSANTKECIKCNSTIEKNGGCNHMTCRKCKHEFCWICSGPWSDHGTQWYTCNRFDEKAGVDARDSQAKSRQALERYLHYYNRYANHEQSAKLDKELYEKTEKKMELVQQASDLSWIEVQFLKKAVETLTLARMTLKWTYCFAYYLNRENQTELFEDNQRDLEMIVEQLSELLEKPLPEDGDILELKQSVLNKSVYVMNRREILLVDTANGLAEGRWTFNVPLKKC